MSIDTSNLFPNMPQAEIAALVNVEFRDTNAPDSIISKKTAYLRPNGEITDCYPTANILTCPNLPDSTQCYIAIRYQNHLSLLSHLPILATHTDTVTYDFSLPDNVISQNPHVLIMGDKALMPAGDFDRNEVITAGDYRVFQQQISSITGSPPTSSSAIGGINFAKLRQNLGRISNRLFRP